jgi:phage nucleotide-binding protein
MSVTPIRPPSFPIRAVADIRPFRSWAIYGRSGSGKTTFASTFPGPTLLLDIEDHGTDSISDCAHVEVAEIAEWEDMEDVYDMLRARTNKYHTVVFDTVTQLQLLCANYLLAKKRKPAIETLRWGALTMQDYGNMASAMKELITRFRNLPLEVVFLAQERTSHDEQTNEELLVPEVGPALTPSIASHLNACVSIIAATYVKRRRRKKGKTEEIIPVHSMRIGPNPIYTTKVRKPKTITLPDAIDDPTYTDVIEIIEGREL